MHIAAFLSILYTKAANTPPHTYMLALEVPNTQIVARYHAPNKPHPILLYRGATRPPRNILYTNSSISIPTPIMKSQVSIPIRRIIQPIVNAVDVQSDFVSSEPDQRTTYSSWLSPLICSHPLSADRWVHGDQ
jgi:hypothetical protein